NDGVHPPEEKSATLLLSKGVHRLALAAFNGGGEFELELEYSSARLPRQPVVPTLSEVDEPRAAEAGTAHAQFQVEPELAERGKALFTKLGCASCHQFGTGEKTLRSRLEATPLGQLEARGGCLEPGASAKAPDYHLSAAQKGAVAAAIGALA